MVDGIILTRVEFIGALFLWFLVVVMIFASMRYNKMSYEEQPSKEYYNKLLKSTDENLATNKSIEGKIKLMVLQLDKLGEEIKKIIKPEPRGYVASRGYASPYSESKTKIYKDDEYAYLEEAK